MGLTKVASTFLQKEIFPHIEGIQFHRKRDFEEFRTLKDITLDKSHLFSSEKDKRIEDIVDEILNYLPDARFILIVRRHDQWIFSRYKYYIRKHGWKSFEEFFDLESDNGIWKKDDLLLRKKIEHIEKKCMHPPLILTHDLLNSDPDRFLQKLCNYLNGSLQPVARKNAIVNRAFSEKQLIVLRKFNGIKPYEEIRSPSRILNRMHYRYRQFLLHIVAFFALFFPRFLMKRNSLLNDPELLDHVRDYFNDDWQFCVDYTGKS